MKTIFTIRVLNELLTLLSRSLPAYLADAQPWAPPEEPGKNRAIHTALGHLAADQKRYAQRVARAIEELGSRPDPGRFPIEFTSKNDLALDYLCREVIQRQEQDILVIEHCAAELEDIAALHALAEEILGNAKGHLEILKGIRD